MVRSDGGYSLLELLVAITLIVIGAAATIPFAHASVDRSRTAGAARYLASRLTSARFEAVKRSAYVAIQFVKQGDQYRFGTYLDGNRNGVLSRDIARGTDPLISPLEQLNQHFPDVMFGIWPIVTAIDPGDRLNLGDPIQIGSSTLLSFSPNGSATSGTLYIRGRQWNQFAVRVLGATGRTRVLRYDFADGRWRSP
jgi:prepilin-type N-terminal cleavage/methylation domain-containing protein